MNAKVIYTGGLQFVGESGSGHAVVMDGTPDVGGRNTGMRPMEMLLVALGGCTGMDVASILTKKKQPFKGLEVAIKGAKAEGYPKRFTEIALDFTVRGKGVSEEAVRKAIEISMEKYCSVKASLLSDVTWSYRIEE